MKLKAFVPLLLFAAYAAVGEEKIELNIVLVGKDDAVMQVPAPWRPSASLSAAVEDRRLESVFPPPVPPPRGDWPRPVEQEFPPGLLAVPRPPTR